ncbi:MAG: hypothetical protein AAFP20_25740, partial [Cyanobacteria bacterium J06614_10]
SHMTFNYHIDELHKKIVGKLMYINRVKDQFDKNTRIMIIEALILSHINYCISVWGSTNNTQLNRVQKLLNFAAKVADGNAMKFDHVTPILKDLKWLKIDQQYRFTLCCRIWKIVYNESPNWLFTLPRVGAVTGSTTRQSNNLFVPRYSLDSGARAFEICAPKLWNALPNSIKELQNFSSFKTKMKNYLLGLQ